MSRGLSVGIQALLTSFRSKVSTRESFLGFRPKEAEVSNFFTVFISLLSSSSSAAAFAATYVVYLESFQA